MPSPHVPAPPSRFVILAFALLLASCGGGGGNNDPRPTAPEETRPQDSRTYTVVPPSDTATYPDHEAGAHGDGFQALAGSTVATDRWAGVLDGAPYRIEVPKTWNGKLVMYAHGYEGDKPELTVTTPSALRRHLLDHGYAWAASGYSRNRYDVRAGVEDTNALALAFTRIAAERSRALAAPSRVYITGHSMGGHVTAAAIEDETLATARHKMRYDGAVPMCGVTGDTELFDYFAAYQLAAQALAGHATQPADRWADIAASVAAAMFSASPTPQALQLRAAVQQLTGGERPIFEEGYANAPVQGAVWTQAFLIDGTLDGILNRPVVDTRGLVVQFDGDPAVSADEAAFNHSLTLRRTPGDNANRLRADGLRWVPKVNGEFKVPVVALHGLGDMYVPFSMSQAYRRRAEAHGNGNWLVQRSIRSPGHCDYTVAEQVRAFSDMVAWAEQGAAAKPSGDDVLTPATLAQPHYGCAYTVNTASLGDDAGTLATRATMPACTH